MEGYSIDTNKIKYGEYSMWDPTYCSLPNDYYLKEQKIVKRYRKVPDTRYVLLENFNYNNNIKIYQNNEAIDFDIISNENQILKIDLKRYYTVENLLFYIDSIENYKISLYADNVFRYFAISKEIKDEKILIPDKTWITKDSNYEYYSTSTILKNTGLTQLDKEYYTCRYQEKFFYNYKITKEYYDDDYHLYVEGYIKDTDDYKVFYKGEPITNTIEITKEKIVKEPKIEYIYIPSENKIIETDSSKEINCLPEIKTEIIEKEILKIPKKVYIIIILLLLFISFLAIKLSKKYVD